MTFSRASQVLGEKREGEDALVGKKTRPNVVVYVCLYPDKVNPHSKVTP